MDVEVKQGTWESFLPFWLDDCAYQVGRGTRPLAMPGEVGSDTWADAIESGLVTRTCQAHGVVIHGDECSAELPDGSVECWVSVVVAAEPHVMDLYRLAGRLIDGDREHDRNMGHALMGMLLGYSPQAVQQFIEGNRQKALAKWGEGRFGGGKSDG